MPNTIDKRKPTRRHIRVKFNNKEVEKIPNLLERKSHKGVRSRLIIKLLNSNNGSERYFLSVKTTLKLEFCILPNNYLNVNKKCFFFFPLA